MTHIYILHDSNDGVSGVFVSGDGGCTGGGGVDGGCGVRWSQNKPGQII